VPQRLGSRQQAQGAPLTVEIFVGDVRRVLQFIPDESVHCVVTSPPYWGLRDYGVEGQLGLERTLGEHLDNLVELFRDVRRVMRNDGLLWLNYGDSYATTPNGRSAADQKAAGTDDRTFRDKLFSTIGPIYDAEGGGGGFRGPNKGNTGGTPHGRVVAGGTLKPKDLIGTPWRLAFALQADGWWLRDCVIWHKPNPMPSSVKSRCTFSYEYVFMLAKSEKYFFDHTAIMEPIAETSKKRYAQKTINQQQGGPKQDAYEAGQTGQPTKSRRPNEIVQSLAKQHKQDALGKRSYTGFNEMPFVEASETATMRAKRNVWTIPTQPVKEAHFATFPERLVEPCILAGCPVGGTVLDPFGGSGTTGLVAKRLGRNAILIELNTEYAAMARQRIDEAKRPNPFAE
jgi:DNA modification methylase